MSARTVEEGNALSCGAGKTRGTVPPQERPSFVESLTAISRIIKAKKPNQSEKLGTPPPAQKPSREPRTAAREKPRPLCKGHVLKDVSLEVQSAREVRESRQVFPPLSPAKGKERPAPKVAPAPVSPRHLSTPQAVVPDSPGWLAALR